MTDNLATTDRTAQSLNVSGKARDFSRLTEFPELRDLRVYRVAPEHLPVISRISSLRTLTMLHVRAGNLAPLSSLKQLENLSIDDSAELTDLRVLGELPALKNLSLIHLRALNTLNHVPLAHGLTGLFVAGAMWTDMRVATLDPIARLPQLATFRMVSARVGDGSLRPLGDVATLRDVGLPNYFALAEFAYLAAALARGAGPCCTPFHHKARLTEWTETGVCRRCWKYTGVMTIGQPRKTLCPVCDKARLDNHVAKWRDLVEEARTEFAARGRDVDRAPLDENPIESWNGARRELTDNERVMLELVHKVRGAHNSLDHIVFEASGHAGLMVRTENGAEPVFLRFTLADSMAKGLVSREAVLRYIAGPKAS